MNNDPVFSQELHGLSEKFLDQLMTRLEPTIAATLESLAIHDISTTALRQIYLPLAATLAKTSREQESPLVVGINGAQGSGKTTLCQILQLLLESGFERRVTTLSIDDLYLTHQQRKDLAQKVHPLFITRGVPGTHDISLGLSILENLIQPNAPGPVTLPKFDKARDDRAPPNQWDVVSTPIDLVLFEGWCVGAIAQPETALLSPVNTLEENEDPEGLWRRYVNDCLQKHYAQMFSRLDRLIMLKIPDMDCVLKWRRLQERKLANSTTRADNSRIMGESALRRFIMHYERLTRHMLAEMPARADMVLSLNQSHQIDKLKINEWPTKTRFRT